MIDTDLVNPQRFGLIFATKPSKGVQQILGQSESLSVAADPRLMSGITPTVREGNIFGSFTAQDC